MPSCFLSSPSEHINDYRVVDAATAIKRQPSAEGTPIGMNDLAIARHAIAIGASLISNNLREFSRVPHPILEDKAPAG